MTTSPSKQKVLEMYTAAGGGDFAGAMACMADDITVTEPSYLPYGGIYRGKQEFQALLGRINEYADLATITLLYVVAEDDKVFVALQMKDRKTGGLLQLVEQSIVRDGKIVEMKIFYLDAGSMIEAGLKND